ncbi:hypothetical protein FO519_006151 [Halicephalobus sp. NKZ332]|nr:hypothetical protein FO519_006151 [Halicephalobus sp. NKZ332]
MIAKHSNFIKGKIGGGKDKKSFEMASFKFFLIALVLATVMVINTGAQFVYRWPAYYYNPYWGFAWGSNKGEGAPEPPKDSNPPPSFFTNNQ